MMRKLYQELNVSVTEVYEDIVTLSYGGEWDGDNDLNWEEG